MIEESAGNQDRFAPYQSLFRTIIDTVGGPDVLLRVILEASDALIFAKDRNGRYILANPAIARLFRRPLEEIIGKTDDELFTAEEATVLRAGDARVLKDGTTLHSVDRLTVFKEERVFLTTKVPLQDGIGRTIGTFGIATDVTAEIKMHEQLAHLNRVLRAIRAVNQLVTKEKDRDRLLQRTCELLIETSGYRSAWIVLFDDNKNATAFFQAGLNAAAAPIAAALQNNDPLECVRIALEQPGVVLIEDPIAECGYCPLAGKARDQRELAARLEYEGKVYGVIVVSVPREYIAVEDERELLHELAGDISFALHDLEVEQQQRRVQEALRESEANYRSIVENSHAGILVVDDAYRCIYANDELCRLFGRSHEEIIGHDFREFIDDESRDLVADRYRRRQAGEDVPSRYEFNVVQKGGDKRRVEVSSTVIRDSAGRVKTIAQLLDITARTELQRKLSAIYALERKLVLMQDPDEIARAAVEGARELLGMEDCALYLIEEEQNRLVLTACLREVPAAFHAIPLDSDRGIIAAAARTGQTIHLPDVSQDPRYLTGRVTSHSELCVPLKVRGQIIGAINAESPRLDAFTSADQQLLETLADTTAVALKGAQLYHELVVNHERLQQTMEGILEALTAAVELRDPYTAGHQVRVAELAVAIAKEMGVSDDVIAGVRYAALVHDIGKLAVPAEILAKPSGLTETEFALIKAHPGQAYVILNGIEFPWPIADIVLQHHERLDGSGYPRGLKDSDIRLEARILAVADVVEAMSSHRPYRPARGVDAALDEIRQNSGTLYDPDVVAACLSVFKKGFSFTARGN